MAAPFFCKSQMFRKEFHKFFNFGFTDGWFVCYDII